MHEQQATTPERRLPSCTWFRMPVLLRTCFTPPRAVQMRAEGTRAGGRASPTRRPSFLLSSFCFASSRLILSRRIHFPPRPGNGQNLEAPVGSRTHPARGSLPHRRRWRGGRKGARSTTSATHPPPPPSSAPVCRAAAG